MRGIALKPGLYLLLVVLCVPLLWSGCAFFRAGAPPLPNIADVVALAEPSVVAINTETVTYDRLNRMQTSGTSGSGWIMQEDGVIVTNNHVVEGATTVTVTLSDGRVFLSESVTTDSLTDLAIVKINAGKLPAAQIGDSSKVRVGDWVVVIGNPLGLGISAKQGIISRRNVSMVPSPGFMLSGLLETSAAINSGNSGGPLLNLSGEVIGIASLKIGDLGVEGMGYAININDAMPVLKELASCGCIERAWLGPSFKTVDKTLSTLMNLPVKTGALVTDIVAGSPAENGGLKKGDVIVSLDDKEISTAEQLVQLVSTSKIGQTIKLDFWRGKDKQTVSVELITSPPCKY